MITTYYLRFYGHLMLNATRSTKKSIPGPSFLELVLEPPKNPCAIHLELAQEYGKIYKIPGIIGYYALNHPDYIEHVLKTNYKNYIKTDIAYQGIRSVMGNGLLANADNESWLHQRRTLQPLFQPQQFNHFVPTIIESTLALCQRWEIYAKQNTAFNVAEEMLALLFEILAKTLFTGDFVEHNEELRHFTHVSNRYVCRTFLYSWLPTPLNIRFRRGHKSAHDIVLDVIEKRRRNPNDHNDLLTILLAAKDNNTGASLSSQQIIDEIKTFLMTGHETTGTALAWALYNLATHPNETQVLQQELSTTLNGASPSLNDLQKLPYNLMVCEETLRMYPPIWLISRRSVNTDNIDGYPIPAKKTLIMSPYVMHHLNNYWDEPLKFNPLRFTTENKSARHKFVYIPFGVGPRSCIGGSFAMLQMQLVLATIMQRFNIESIAHKPIKLEPLITLRPYKGIWVKVHKK